MPVVTKDALAGKHGEYEIVLANPPFGKKSSVTIVNESGDSSKESLIINRDDFWASTSNKQLNFLQHIFTILKQHGRAAVVLPDNVLFEGGAGERPRGSATSNRATNLHSLGEGKPSGANCSNKRTFTHCCGFPPGYFMPKA